MTNVIQVKLLKLLPNEIMKTRYLVLFKYTREEPSEVNAIFL